MSFLPELPSGFGRDSAYPPMPMRPSAGTSPPRHYNAAAGSSPGSPARPVFMAPPSDGSMRPGDIVAPQRPSSVPPQTNALHAPAGAVASMGAQPFRDTRHNRAPSPAYRPLTPEVPLASDHDHLRPPSTPPRQVQHAYQRPHSPQRQQSPVIHRQSSPVMHRQPSPVPPPAPAARRQASPPPLPTLHLPITNAKTLGEQREAALASAQDMEILRWASKTLKYVEHMHAVDAPVDEQVEQWVDEAIIHIVQVASSPNPEPEALFARGELLASGAFPTYVSKDLRSAFSDFEQSARRGWAPSWYRIGCDYEMVGDISRARSAFERGAKARDVSSRFRLGVAYVLGELELGQDVPRGVALIRSAADEANENAPHAAYAYGLMLAGEQYTAEVPLDVLAPGSSRAELAPLAKRYLERAAYFNLPAAQYKCGECYEHAQLSFPFDPLLSVQYYSAASQGGDSDADMALSKWFLCGAANCFDKNEHLAWTFADRAARHQLPTAEFAMGYYYEVGIGVTPDVEKCKEWYRKAAAQGNRDAAERLAALEHEEVLSRAQHQQHLDAHMYAQHTAAMNQPASRARVDQSGSTVYGYAGHGAAPQHTEMARSQTMRMVDVSARTPTGSVRVRPGGAVPGTHRPDTRPGREVPKKGGGSGSGSGTGGSTGTSSGPTTFSEMGIKTKHERDCVIM
ncbi:hypothetical protein MCUN1_002951 [Malassezia cuniculi]|uniref:HCP-like protein n=1 Tax=Malassezia cuniculi TaxID=948313 RepID=A0AAF0EW10_9BASI|nr:hypothetical protein MCUN1_002951 [Malassezia cuniculi]